MILNGISHEKTYTPSDVLAVIVGGGVRTFISDPKTIHITLWKAKRYYPILNVFAFTVGDVYPFSRELEDAINILQRSRLIFTDSPDYKTYTIARNINHVAAKILERFDDVQKKQLRELSMIFRVECEGNELSSVG